MAAKQELSFITNTRKPPMKLYRYFSNVDYALEAINSGEIYCSLSDTFNDIFDCRIINDGSVLDADVSGEPSFIISYVNGILLDCKDFFVDFFSREKSFEQMERDFKNSLSNGTSIKPSEYLHFVHRYSEREDDYSSFYAKLKAAYIEKHPLVSLCMRVACFSEVKDSILMWSYYTNNHKGVCLEYDLTLLDNEIEDNQNILNAIQKVHYSETQYNNTKCFCSPNDLNSVFFTKALCWSHEQEWRLVLTDNIERVKFPCLTGVYLGANFRQACDDLKREKIREFPNQERSIILDEEDYFVKIIKACMKRGDIGVYEAIQDREKYKIDFIEIVRANGER